MGDVVKFPSHEKAIEDRLATLHEGAKEGVILAFVYVIMDQGGEHVFDYLGEIDEPSMISALNSLKREIKKLE